MEQIAELIAALDRFLANSVGEAATRLAADLYGPVTSAIVLSLTWLCIGAIYGTHREPLMELGYKLLVIVITVEIALTGGLYAHQIIPSVLAIGDGLAAALLPGQSIGAAQFVTEALTLVVDTVKGLWEKAGVFSGEGLGFMVAAGLFTVCATIVLGYGLGYMLVAKISTAILLAVGPLCIISILWRPASWLFDGWVKNLVNYAVLGALFSAVLSIIASLYGSYFSGAALGQVDITEAMFLVLVVSVVGLLVMAQIPHLCSALVGGATLQIARPLHQMASAAKFGKYVATTAGRGTASIGRSLAYPSTGVQSMSKQNSTSRNTANAAQSKVPTLPSPPLLALPAPPKPATTMAVPVTTAKTGVSSGVRYQAGSSTGTPGKSPGIRWKTYRPKSGGKP